MLIIIVSRFVDRTRRAQTWRVCGCCRYFVGKRAFEKKKRGKKEDRKKETSRRAFGRWYGTRTNRESVCKKESQRRRHRASLVACRRNRHVCQRERKTKAFRPSLARRRTVDEFFVDERFDRPAFIS